MPVSTCGGDVAASHMALVAHEDDDILFMNYDIAAAIANGEAMTTVFVTAGDAGRDQSYWAAREDGARAAYSVYAGSTDWVHETVELSHGEEQFSIATSYLADRPEIRLYFLRLPDGFRGGDGSGRNGYESLLKLWNGSIDEAHSVDGANSYTRAELADTLLMLMERHQPSHVMVQDHVSILAPSEHSDHFNASLFATLAQQGYTAEHDFEAYVGYGSRQLPVNLLDPGLLRLYFDAFEAYGAHDPAVQTGTHPDGSPIFGNSYYDWMQREYHVDDVMDIWSLDFDLNSSWRTERHERLLADSDGDGRADILGFGQRSVLVAAAEEIRSAAPKSGRRNSPPPPAGERAAISVPPAMSMATVATISWLLAMTASRWRCRTVRALTPAACGLAISVMSPAAGAAGAMCARSPTSMAMAATM